MSGRPKAAREEVEAMLVRMAAGDRAAMSSLYAATSAKLFGIALRVSGDHAEAEDALQEIYVKVWLNARHYRAEGLSPMSWLITVARNHAVDRLRRRGSGVVLHSFDDVVELADPSPSPEEVLIANSMHGAVRDCLAQLKPPRADAVCRAYVYGASYAELADRYHVPLNTIRNWLRRSLIQLRECLGP